MPRKSKKRKDEPVTLYREGEDPEETLRALLEVKKDIEPSENERREA